MQLSRDNLERVMRDMASASIDLHDWQNDLLYLAGRAERAPTPMVEDVVASYCLLRSTLGLLKPVYRDFAQLRLQLEGARREEVAGELARLPMMVREPR